MPTPAELLQQSLAKFRTANRIDGNKNSYRKDNPNEYQAVMAYLSGGARPNATSDMGMALVLEEDARRALATGPTGATGATGATGPGQTGATGATGPPPVGNPIPANGRINQGGVYSGNYTGGTIVIDTPTLVTITNAVITNTGGDVFRGLGGGYTIKNLVLDHVRINGGASRVFDIDGAVENITVSNCTIEKTEGMKISVISPINVARILITRTRIHNIQGSPGNLTQFVQWNGTVAASAEVSWNEIVNDDPEGSFAEDVMSLHACDGVYVHDNFFDGQWTPGNPATSSQGGITMEEGARNCRVENNILVATHGLTINYNCGPNNSIVGNRYVHSGLLPDGVTKIKVGYAGLVCFPGAPGRPEPQNGNHAHENVIGHMNGSIHGGGRLDWEDDDLPPDCLGRNTHMAPVGGTITQAHEQAERDRWRAKLTAAGVTVGA